MQGDVDQGHSCTRPSARNAAAHAAPALLEQRSVNRLAGNGPLPGSNDHLAVRGSHASRRIQPGDRRSHTVIDDDLSVVV